VASGFLCKLVVTSQLTEEKNFWLKYLTNDIKDVSVAERIAREYKKHWRDPLCQSMMDVIVHANEELFEEVRYMCQAIRDLFKDEFEAGMAEGEAKERSAMCREIDRILENSSMNAEMILEGIREYIAAKKAEGYVTVHAEV